MNSSDILVWWTFDVLLIKSSRNFLFEAWLLITTMKYKQEEINFYLCKTVMLKNSFFLWKVKKFPYQHFLVFLSFMNTFSISLKTIKYLAKNKPSLYKYSKCDNAPNVKTLFYIYLESVVSTSEFEGTIKLKIDTIYLLHKQYFWTYVFSRYLALHL